MKFIWLAAILSATAWAAPEAEPSDQGYSSNWAAFGEIVQSLMALPTKNVNLDNIDKPPRSLIGEIINNVPPTAMVQLAVPSQRSALASDFSAGNTPDWYQSLPTDVRSYLSTVKSQIAEGALTATPTAAGVTETPTPVTTTADEGAGVAATTTSEAMGVGARPTTGAVVVSGMGALGVLGMVLAL